MTELEGKISLMLNFKEDDHKKLHDLIRKMLASLEQGGLLDGKEDRAVQSEGD